MTEIIKIISPELEVGKRKSKEESLTIPNIGIRKMVTLDLKSKQLALIGKALMGNLRESEKEVAKELNREILKKMISHEKSNLNQLEMFAEHVQNEIDGTEEPSEEEKSINQMKRSKVGEMSDEQAFHESTGGKHENH
jgi:hypothetical protein